MDTQSPLEIVSEYIAALAASDSDRMDSLRSTNFVLDLVYGDAFETGPLSVEETKRFWPSWFAGFPGFDFEVIRTIAAEEVVVTQWIFTGTHTEPLKPPVFEKVREPTGRTIRFRGVSFYDIKDSLIERETMYMDVVVLFGLIFALALLREKGRATEEKGDLAWEVSNKRCMAAQASLRGIVLRAAPERRQPKVA